MPLTVLMRSRKSWRSRRSHEAIENMGVFAHHKMRQELHDLAGRGQFVVRGQRDERLVADAVDLHRDLGRQRIRSICRAGK